MTINYVQTQDAATFDVGCSGQTAGVTTTAGRAQIGGTPGSTAVGCDPGNNVTRACAAFDCDAPGAGYSWDAGTWTVPINHSAMDGGTQLTRVDICDYDGSTFTTIASNTAPGHVRGGTGVLSVDVVQGSAHTPQSATLSRPFIVLTYNNSDAHGASTLDITPDQTIVAPLTAVPIDIFVSDTGSGADNAPSLAASASVVDTGSGADLMGPLLATVPITDVAAGAEALSRDVLLTVSDSATGVDVMSRPAVTVFAADGGAGVEQLSASVSAAVTDTGSGAESVAADVALSVTDTGAGTDAVTATLNAELADNNQQYDGGSALFVSDSDHDYVGQSFEGQGGLLSSIVLRLADQGLSGATIRVEVFEHTGTYGGASGLPLNAPSTPIAVSAGIDENSIGSDFTNGELVEFTFDETLSLELGTPYVWAVTKIGGTGTLWAFMKLDNVHAGRAMWYDDPTWTSTANWDIYFEVYELAAASGDESIFVVDTGAGADVLPGISVSAGIADAALGVEAFDNAASATVTDAFTGVDLLRLAVQKVVMDTAVAADALGVVVSVTAADSGTGTDAAPTLSVSAALADVATGADAAPRLTVVFSVADVGAATDLISVVTEATKLLTDAGVGVESINVATTGRVTDSWAAAEALTVSVTARQTDSATGTDTLALSAAAAVADAMASADTVAATAQVRVVEAAAGVDADPRVQVQLTLLDTASGTEEVTLVLDSVKQIAEVASAADAVLVSAQAYAADSAAAADTVADVTVSFALGDVATSSDALRTVKERLVTLADAALANDAVRVVAAVRVPDVGAGETLLRVLADIRVLDEYSGLDAVLSFDPNVRIATIVFQSARRFINFSFAHRTAEYALAQRSVGFTLH